MVGVLLILIGLAGLFLGILGRSLLPLFAAAGLMGLLLLGASSAGIAQQSWRRRAIPLKLVLGAAAGLALLDFLLCARFALVAVLGHSNPAKAAAPLKCLASFLLLVVAPSAFLLFLRRRQFRAPGQGEDPADVKLLWDFRRAGTGVASIAVVLLLLGLLLPLYGGWPPVMLAVRCHSQALTRLSIALGADVKGTGSRWTPLNAAVEQGDAAVAALLLDAGADPNCTSCDVPPLTSAVMRGDPEVVELLLKRGADPDAPSVFGPPLCLAAMSGYRRIAVILLAHGADPGVRNAGGKTALELARELGHPEVAKVLEKAPAPEEVPFGR